MERIYVAIDLKSFYASVECVERHLNPLTTNLVVADESRSDKTICLAISPSLKSYGISSRPRLFEVKQKIKEINQERKQKNHYQDFQGSSYHHQQLIENSFLEVDYIVAMPRMAHYIEYSSRIYSIYLKYVSKDDIHVYSIDEVFIDITSYLKTYQLTPRQLTMKIIKDVLKETGITATAGIGTNLYLAKVAMDIVAKKSPPDKNGVRIAELDEMKYRKELWNHQPITDFWRVGRGYAKRLEKIGLYTMGDIAKCSVGDDFDDYNEGLLYQIFGVNAELLIDHAWGYEPCTIKDIKSYQPENNSLGSGQVLHKPYPYEKARLIVLEMIDQLSLDLVSKRLVTNQIVLTIGYDRDNLNQNKDYVTDVVYDHFGRKIPKHSHGTICLKEYTSSTKILMEAIDVLFERIINKHLFVRRINMSLCHIYSENHPKIRKDYDQLDLFTNYDDLKKQEEQQKKDLEKERSLQETLLSIKQKYGKNAILKGMNLQEDATMKERNEQIGGHKA